MPQGNHDGGETEPDGRFGSTSAGVDAPGSGLTIVYSAIGADHVRAACRSASSAKRHMPAARTYLLADHDVGHHAIDVFVPASAVDSCHGQAKQSKLNKVDAILNSSGERVLYVDTDTHFAADVSQVFDQKREFDIAFVHDTWQFADIYRKLNNGLPAVDPPPGEPFVNCGVLFLRRNAATDAFLRSWQACYRADPR